jgi:hypothetical protein
VRRYAPAELAAVLGAVLAASTVDWFGNAAATAFAGSVGETIAFYSVLLVRDLRARRRRRPRHRVVYTTLRDLMVEFGLAELADTLAIRPFAMYLGPMIVGNVTIGVALGKIGADLVFYTLVIIGYEIRKSAIPLDPTPQPTPRG